MWANLQETADLVTSTEEILNGKLHFCALILNSDIVPTPVLKSYFNKVAELQVCYFIEKRLPHRGSAEQYLGLIQMQRFCENRQPWQMELDIQKQYTKAFLNRVL